MTRDELSKALRDARLSPGDLVYVERRGADLAWRRVENEPLGATGVELPDAWLYFGGEWPSGEDERWGAFFDDLLAEMDSMAGGADRCRWSADDPWPRGHGGRN